MHSKTKLNKKQVNKKVGSTDRVKNLNKNFMFNFLSEKKKNNNESFSKKKIYVIIFF